MKRREFLAATTLGATSTLLGVQPPPAGAEPPPETTTIRLVRFPFDVVCTAPQWVAEELLRAEGFSTVEYVTTRDPALPLAAGEVDIALLDAPGLLLLLDAGKPLVTLMGVHGGCYELFASQQVRSVRDLHGRTVAVATSGYQAFVAAMVSYVGLNPRKDVTFVLKPEATQLFAVRDARAALTAHATPSGATSRDAMRSGHRVGRHHPPYTDDR